ncbi:hypothetical protein, partial [Anaerosalibacter massiliensis]|uniref:hypothetical protein n=1 Tax=Anaerosalibacter massiliensis TaxID=1347392 RepID=UPI0005B27B00
QFAAQPYNAASDPNPPTPPMDGPYVSSLMQFAAQPDGSGDFGEADSMSGPNVALLPHQVTQTSSIITPLDTLLYETPYIQLSRDGCDLNTSKVSAYVARSSDRTVDSYTLFTKHEADANYTSAGTQPWTPWGMSTVGLGFFTDEVTIDPTSDKDGVPVAPAKVGDLLLIDQELMSITAINGRTYKIGRGVADTIPAQHYSKRPVWLI